MPEHRSPADSPRPAARPARRAGGTALALLALLAAGCQGGDANPAQDGAAPSARSATPVAEGCDGMLAPAGPPRAKGGTVSFGAERMADQRDTVAALRHGPVLDADLRLLCRLTGEDGRLFSLRVDLFPHREVPEFDGYARGRDVVFEFERNDDSRGAVTVRCRPAARKGAEGQSDLIRFWLNTTLDYSQKQREKLLSAAARRVIPRLECLRAPDFTRPYTKRWSGGGKVAR